MIKIQQEFVKILKSKESSKKMNQVTIKRWLEEKSSPSLNQVEKICEEHEMEQPFFFDGKVETLNGFVKHAAYTMGMTVDLIFKAK